MGIRIGVLALLCGAAAMTVTAQDVSRPSPSFSVQRVGAPAIPLSQYRGKILVVAFINTTCPHCQALTRVLTPIANEYAPRGVQFLECAFDEGAQAAVPLFIQQYAPSFPVGWSTREAVMAYFQVSVMDTRPFYVPHMVFVDKAGIIRGDYPGESGFFQNAEVNIRAELDKLLKAGTTASKKK